MLTRPRGALAVVLTAALGIAVCGPASAADSTDDHCSAKNVNTSPPDTSATVPAVTLTTQQPANIVNFGGSRKRHYVDVVLNATPPLPKGFDPRQIVIDVPRRLSRDSATLPSASAPKPTVTPPVIGRERTQVTFTVCLDGDGMRAGHYAGVINASGPDGITPVDIPIETNAQNAWLFWLVLIGSGIAVFLLLLWRGAVGALAGDTAQRAADLSQASKALSDAAAGGDPAETQRRAAEVTARANAVDTATGRSAGRIRLSDGVTALLTTAAAAAAAYAVYSSNPSWGDDGVKAAAALVGTMLGAAGLRSLIATAARR